MMKKRSFDLVMFDLDGTLADTGQDLADAVNHTRDRFNLRAVAGKLSLYPRGPRCRTSPEAFVARR